MKRLCLILLIATIILSSIPIDIVNASTLTKFSTDEEFYDYVELTLGARYITNERKTLYANRETFNEYQQIVYGGQHGDKRKGVTPWVKPGYEHLLGKMLPRYIGYDWNGGSVGNTHFTPDATSGNDPSTFKYISSSANTKAWEGVHRDVADHMLNAELWGNGAKPPFTTLNKLGGRSYGKPVSLATWLAEGSIYMIHNNGKNYVTQNVTSMLGSASGVVNGQITTPTDTYYIRKDETQVKIPVTVRAKAELKGYAKATHIEEITASFQGKADRKKGVSEASTTQDFIATRANYNVGTHDITLEGNVSLRTIFNDTGSNVVRKNVKLIVEAEGEEPYVTTTVTPNPKQKQFEGNDIDVTLTVKGDLQNYTKTSNIKEWVFYARQKEDTKALEKKVYTKTLNASTDYIFKIPASKIIEDNFTQNYVVRARVYFNEKVNGKDFYDAPAETFVEVYKSKPKPPVKEPVNPEPDNNIPPVARIGGLKEYIIGETGTFTCLSWDSDGEIVERIWTHDIPGATDLTGKGGEIAFNDLGRYNISLYVIDDKGAGDSIEHQVEVLPPPPPVAKLKFEGALKVNRNIKVTNESSSHRRFPIIEEKTQITIEPIDHGATDRIFYSGTLTDNLLKEIVFKDEGTYKFTIYVENTAGLSDSIEYIKYIQPDVPPIADFSLIQKLYRDPFDNNYAKMEITDFSFSPDGDPIVERVWSIRYNSTNNKNADGINNFSDDPILNIKDSQLAMFIEKTFTHNGVIYKVTKTAKDKLDIRVNQVGAYLLDLEVTEGFGQDFIPEHVNPSDYQKGNTSDKHHFEKTITVFNREPFVDFN